MRRHSVLLRLALFAIVSRVPPSRSGARRFLTVFLRCDAHRDVAEALRRVTVNWIGYLPVSDLVLCLKYQEPLIASCIAILWRALVLRRILCAGVRDEFCKVRTRPCR